ncbi:hypothetical protein CKF54_07965, partial [Psittacicella hinzii]
MKVIQYAKLPEHRKTFKKTPSGKYVYYKTRMYRNQNGTNTCDEICIGKLDEEKNLLIINKNYHKVFPTNEYYVNNVVEKTDKVDKYIVPFGVQNAVNKLSEDLGLTSLLKKHFGNNHTLFLSLVTYMISKGNVMSGYEKWAKKHYLPLRLHKTSQEISQIFAKIEETKILAFLDDWLDKAIEEEYIAYDVTSISSYSTNIRQVKYGYNRDSELLAQVNLAIFYGQDSKLPLYYTW